MSVVYARAVRGPRKGGKDVRLFELVLLYVATSLLKRLVLGRIQVARESNSFSSTPWNKE